MRHKLRSALRDAMRGSGGGKCFVELTDDPVGSDLTVTAADCRVYYDNMHVPGGITVSVAPGGRLIDRVGVGSLDYMLNLGDSKTAGDTWPTQLLALLSTVDALHPQQVNFSMSGSKVQPLATRVEILAPLVREPVVLATINIGVNDSAATLVEANFKASYRELLDALLARWPSCMIYVAKIWGRPYVVNCVAINGFIDEIVGEYGASVVVGMDETIWLEGGDDGATNSLDGVHYSEAGETAAAAAWFATIGA